MPEGTHEHLEHAQHAAHAAHDPFDRNVAMTMTVVAAMLAVVTLMSHRAHTETLRLTTLAAVYKGHASDEWNYYQAKNIRRHIYNTSHEIASFVGKQPGTDAPRKAAQERWDSQLAEYKEDLPKQKAKAEELDKRSEDSEKSSEIVHHRADRYDLGELFVELALILSSIAVLTKRRSYWYAGMGFCVIGAAIAATGFFII